METKIKIQFGSINIDYEGSESFLKNEIPKLIHTISELYPSEISKITTSKESNGKSNGKSDSKIQLSTNSIAAKLNVKSGSSLAVAAAAHLTLVKNKKVFSRKELLTEMQTATSYFKETYRKNLTRTLGTLIKNKFNEPSTGNYALTADAEKELRSILAK